MIPSQMTAIEIEGGQGPAEGLGPIQISTASPSEGQILVRVRAAGVNRPDILQRQGAYPPPPGAPDTLGLEIAGEVVTAAGRWKVGDRVTALLGGGGYAEYAAADARHALPIPKGLDFIAAASLPETVFTVFANVFEHGALRPSETLMVHGANSGIGVAAIQMAKAFGAKVIATARGPEKVAAARELGADLAIDVTSEDFAEPAKAFGGADVILDMVGAPYVEGNLAALKPKGRLVYIAHQAGAVLSLPIWKVMQKQAVITGSTLRARSSEEKARLAGEVERLVWPWIEGGQMRAAVDRTFPLKQAADAHAYLESAGHVGKVVLTM